MEEIDLGSWQEFESFLNDEKLKVKKHKEENQCDYISNLLFRGHAKESWSLETTLERYTREKNLPDNRISWEQYNRYLNSILPALSSHTERSFEFEELSNHASHNVPPSYSLMVYLRHHGFPSPLLDWSISPYVAAYFAYSSSILAENIAIYTFREYTDGSKAGWVGAPRITGLGPYVRTHKRHFLQQCEYTICTEKDDENTFYCPHEKITYCESQDYLIKLILPSSERKEVLEMLNSMNINSYSLFGSEESLVETLAYKEIEGEGSF